MSWSTAYRGGPSSSGTRYVLRATSGSDFELDLESMARDESLEPPPADPADDDVDDGVCGQDGRRGLEDAPSPPRASRIRGRCRDDEVIGAFGTRRGRKDRRARIPKHENSSGEAVGMDQFER
jgi:hypothetical protein